MIVITRYRVTPDEQDGFHADAQRALGVLAARPGYVSGTVGRGTDDPQTWVLVTEWANVGSYRRALGNYDVKMFATPLLSRALDEESAFEPLITAAAGQDPVIRASDLA